MSSFLRRWVKGVLLLAVALMLVAARGRAEGSGRALVLHLEGPLTPPMAHYLARGLRVAAAEHAALVVMVLDTPGGSVTLMEQMVQEIRNSPVPVVVYVAPRGAMAGSAGTILVLAGHWAAMAPETALGAASPVGPQGEDLGETLAKKAQQILQALVRSLAARRGPQAVQAAEDTISQARALSAEEALRLGVIDFVAPSLDDLLSRLAGAHATTAAGEVILPAHLVAAPLQPTLAESILLPLTNPNVVFLLLGLGIQVLLIAFWHPSNWPAWFAGVSALLLAAYGLSLLPVNWVGLAFMALAFAMFALDVKATTHGALTAAGLAAFVFGALTLFNTPAALPQQRVSVPLVVGSGAAMALLSTAVVMLALRAQKRPVKTGLAQVHSLVGKRGYARTPLRPGQRGTVQVGGELWSARLAPQRRDVAPGEAVEVVAVQGMHLVVQPLASEGGEAESRRAGQGD